MKQLLEDKIRKFNVGPFFRCLDNRIETPGNGNILFQGMQNHTAESIQSLEGYDIAWVEEAQSLSERSLDLLRPTIRKPGSELWFGWNPRSPKDPVDKLFRAGPLPPNAKKVCVTYTDNPWFPDELRRDMEWDRRRDPQKYAHVWQGKYQVISEAQVFKNWKIEEFETPPDTRFYLGADWGFSVDPSVCVRCFIVDRTLYVDYEAYQVGCEIDKLPELFAKVPESNHWPLRADSARPETISYMKNHGFPNIEPAVKGKDSVKEGIEFLKNYDIVVHPRCIHTADELAYYAYKVDKLTEEVLPKLADDKNHVIDSLRYAVEALRRSGVDVWAKLGAM